MSFGDPNNPYGQPQGQPQQPGYGYPQQGQPAQPQQPGYGYPAAPPPPAYGGGYPGGAPMAMPGITKAARIFLYVIVVCQIVVAGMYGYTLSEFDKAASESLSGTDAEAFADLGKGVLGFLLVLSLVFAALGLALALKYANGGNGVRVCSIVYGSFAIVSGIFTIPVGLITLIVAILLIVFAAKKDSAAWFQRPRH
ncbi:hypothetical protein [Streptomyces sp. CB03238]|uniref:hypothetical protein n=1 Tax=Streptomyces sp. CB03238 TaxID=1907777 RepID=UPI000A121783|nr:hypothetical protein [Streptomyces sp. CB03238]ORT59560.1 hypothetical protein BKD26_11640 [Streptomyces sp. CB03238]